MAFSTTKTLAMFPKFLLLNVNYGAQRSIRNAHAVISRKLLYCDYGDPLQVLRLSEERLKKPKPKEITVEILAAPVNPADLNTIQGVYPKKPPLPATPGNEGVGRVMAVGSEVTSLKVGDMVVPNDSNIGTWRSHGTWNENQWFKVPSNLPLMSAATLMVNPLTAYRMLKDFGNLQPGDTVIQNGANSACGQIVIQLCYAWNIKTVNVIRDRPQIEILKDSLFRLGATHIFTEDEIRTTNFFKEGAVKTPKLGLNCVGGQSGLEVLRRLANGGTMVTYGGMSRNPVTVPTSALIFKDVRVVGYWMTRWMEKNRDSPKAKEMLDDIMNLTIAGKLREPVCTVMPFSCYEDALGRAGNSRGFTGGKIVLAFCDKL